MKKRIFSALLAALMLTGIMPSATFAGDSADLTISTAEELIAFAEKANNGNNFSGQTIELTANIDLDGITWTPIKSFAGEFDGNDYTISNFHIEAVDARGGFFNVIEAGSGERVHDLTLSDVTATVGNNRFGTLANSVQGIVNRVTVKDVTVTTTHSDAWVGGMCAFMSWPWMNDCTVENLTVDATKGAEFVTGFACILQKNNNMIFDNNDVSGFEVTVADTDGSCGVAGFVGQTQRGWEFPKIINSDITGIDVTASGTVDVGGFIAWPGAHTTAENCTTEGKIDVSGVTAVTRYAGGFFGNLGWNCDLGQMGHVVTNCSADVDIITATATAGGFVGSATNDYNRSMYATFTNCIATGDITCTEGGTAFVGGFAGDADRGVYTDCAASGTVTGTEGNAGQFIGVIRDVDFNYDDRYKKGTRAYPAEEITVSNCTYTGDSDDITFIGTFNTDQTGDEEDDTVEEPSAYKPNVSLSLDSYVAKNNTVYVDLDENGKDSTFTVNYTITNKSAIESFDIVWKIAKEGNVSIVDGKEEGVEVEWNDTYSGTLTVTIPAGTDVSEAVQLRLHLRENGKNKDLAWPVKDITGVLINGYYVTLDNNGGQYEGADANRVVFTDVNRSYGSIAWPKTDGSQYTREGYTFAGFAADAEGTGEILTVNELKQKKWADSEITTWYAQWTPNEYTITFDTDGGSAVTPITQDYGTEIIAPADPTKEGYTFAGWNPELPETMPVGGMTTKAQWEAVYENVQIVIYRNGDKTTPYKTVGLASMQKGETLDLTTLDIADYYSSSNGYKFDGWYRDGWGLNDDTITINGWTNILCMVTDYEKVVVHSVIEDDTDSAEVIWNGLALRGEDLLDYLNTAVTNGEIVLDKTGYTPDTWYNKDWFGHKFGEGTTVNGWTNVYVKYTPNTYTLNFDPNGGKLEKKVQSLFYDSVYTMPTPTLENYTFLGWADENGDIVYEGGEEVTGISSKHGDQIYLTAVWEGIIYTLHFDPAGGSDVCVKTNSVNVQSLLMMTKFTMPESIRSGYTFKGWKVDDSNPEQVYSAGEVVSALSDVRGTHIYLTAQWEANTYTITLDLNGGEYTGETAWDVVYDTAYSIPGSDEVSKPGATLLGWNLDYNGVDYYYADGHTLENLTYTADDDVTFTAIWEAKTYADGICLDANGGTVYGEAVVDVEITYGETYTFPTAEREGYTFLYWELATDADKTYLAGDTIVYESEERLTFKAVWDANEYTVTYTDGVDKTTVFKDQEYTVSYGEETPEFDGTPRRKGYRFEGWTPAVSETVTGNVVYTATWVKEEKENSFSLPKLYELSFDVNGGEKMKSLPRAFGSRVNLKEFIPEREGYTFTGWYADQALTEEITKVVMTSNRTVYAGWEEN